MDNSSEEWLSIADAARLTNYNPESIRRLIRQGKIKAKKVVIVWLVEKQSLLDYVDKKNG